MFGLGWGELLIILFIALLFFGPGRLPGLGEAIGKAIRGLKRGLSSDSEKLPPAAPESTPPEKAGGSGSTFPPAQEK